MKHILSLVIFLLASHVSMSQAWSKKESDVFIKTCVDEAKDFLSKDGATAYCKCTMEKLMRLYPNADDVDHLSEEEISVVAEECILSLSETNDLSMTWTKETQQEFIRGCEEELKGTDIDTKMYCPCALQEVMKLYKNPIDAVKMTEEETLRIAEKCLGL